MIKRGPLTIILSIVSVAILLGFSINGAYAGITVHSLYDVDFEDPPHTVPNVAVGATTDPVPRAKATVIGGAPVIVAGPGVFTTQAAVIGHAATGETLELIRFHTNPTWKIPACDVYTLNVDVLPLSYTSGSGAILVIFFDLDPSGVDRLLFNSDGSITGGVSFPTTALFDTGETWAVGTPIDVRMIYDIPNEEMSIILDGGTPTTVPNSIAGLSDAVRNIRFTMSTSVIADTAIDNVSLEATGCDAPVITSLPEPPADITEEATAPGGNSISFATPTATDGLGASLTVSCVPTSPNPVLVGATEQVVCTSAADILSQTVQTSFDTSVEDTTPPSQPTNEAPTNGFAEKENLPLFNWSDSSDTVGVDHYTLDIATDSGFVTIVQTHVINPDSFKQLVTPDELAEDEYFWRVTATDAANNDSPASATSSFTVDTTPPSIVSITSDATAAGALMVGDTIVFTATLGAEAAASVTGSYNNVALTWTTADAGATFTATYTIMENDMDQPAAIQIGGVTADDAAGNTSAAAAGSDVMKTIDAHTPFITSVTSDANSAGVLKVGDTILFTITLVTPESNLDDTAGTVTGSFNGQAVTFTEIMSTGAYRGTYTVVEAEMDRAAGAEQMTDATVTDNAGNFDNVAGTDVAKSIDANTPFIAGISSTVGTDNPTTGILGIDDTLGFTLTLVTDESGLDGTTGTITGSYNGQALTWSEDASYSATYTVVENEDDQNPTPLQLFSVTVTDNAGNSDTQDGDGDVTVPIDAHRPTAMATPAPDPIAEADVGALGFSLAFLFNEDMITTGAANPDVVYSNPNVEVAPITLSVEAGSWNLTPRTFTFTYTVSDNDVEDEVDVDLTGAQDLAGNLMTPFSENEVYEVDTVKPTGTVIIDDGAATTTAADLGVSLDITCVDIGSGCSMFRVAEDGVLDAQVLVAWPGDITDQSATVPAERGIKTIVVEFKDVAGNISVPNEAISTIILNAIFRTLSATPSASDATGEWENTVFTLSGTVDHALVTDINDDNDCTQITSPFTRFFGDPKDGVDDQCFFANNAPKGAPEDRAQSIGEDPLGNGDEDLDGTVDEDGSSPDQAKLDFMYRVTDLTRTAGFLNGYSFPNADGTQTVALSTVDTETDSFEAMSKMPRPTKNDLDTTDGTMAGDHTSTPDVQLIDEFGAVVVSFVSTNDIVVLEHPSAMTQEELLNVFGLNRFDTTGFFSDATTGPTAGTPIFDALVEFTGSGAVATLLDTETHEGAILEDLTGFDVTCSSTCIVKLKAKQDGIAGSDPGAMIDIPDPVPRASLRLEGMGLNVAVVKVTDVNDISVNFDLQGSSMNAVDIPIEAAAGIKSIEVLEIRGPQVFVNNDTDCTSLDGLTPFDGDTDGVADDCYQMNNEVRVDRLELFNEDPANGIDDDADGFTDEDDVEGNPLLDPTAATSFMGISRIDLSTGEDTLVNRIEFESDAAGLTEEVFGTGNYASSGFALQGPLFAQEIRASFDFNPAGTMPLGANQDYLPSQFIRTYDVAFAETGGSGYGSGTATVVNDLDRGINSDVCAGGDDVDEDAICDSAEADGWPYVYGGKFYFLPLDNASLCPAGTICDVGLAPDAGGDGVNNDMDCKDVDGNQFFGDNTNMSADDCFMGSNAIRGDRIELIDERDLYYEIDAMSLHTPDPAALVEVKKTFLKATTMNTPVDVHFIQDNLAMTELSLINMWQDNDLNDENDYNAAKIRNKGTDLIGTRLGGLSTYTNTIEKTGAAGTGTYELTIDGLTITTPLDPRVPGNGQKGLITFQVKIVTAGPTTFACGTPTQAPALGGFWNSPPILRTCINLGSSNVKLITVDVVWANGVKVTNKVLPPLVIPFTLTTPVEAPLGCASTDGAGTPCNDGIPRPRTPLVRTNLENAYQQAVRHIWFAHSYGGPSGQGEIRGNDIAVTLGDGFQIAFNGHPGGNTEEQTGTLLHEIGHNLNLRHGGPKYDVNDVFQTPIADTSINCKANYFSIMSYSRQIKDTYLFGSEWTPSFSDGTHGGSATDSSPRAAANLGGLLESALAETPAPLLAGSVQTLVYATPLSGDSHTTHRHDSNALGPSVGAGQDQVAVSGGVDWDHSGTITGTSAGSPDINDFPTSGCPGALDPTYYDYDDFWHMDFNFRQGSTGQFDGTSAPITDWGDTDGTGATLTEGVFDGLEAPPSQLGENTVKAGSAFPINVLVEDDAGSTTFNLNRMGSQVWFTKDLGAMNTSPGLDPTKEWILVFDNKDDPRFNNDGDSIGGVALFDEDGTPVNGINEDGDCRSTIDNTLFRGSPTDNTLDDCFLADNTPKGAGEAIEQIIDEDPGPELDQMRWIPTTPEKAGNFLQLTAKIPKNGQFPGVAGKVNVEGTWYIRVVLFDRDGLIADGIGLAGAENNPNSNFLKDLVDPKLPDGEHLLATNKISVVKQSGPGGGPPPGGEVQDIPIDTLIATVDGFVDSGDVPKKFGKDWISILNGAKATFAAAGDGCPALQEFEDEVNGAPLKRVDQATKNALTIDLDGINTVQTAKGC